MHALCAQRPPIGHASLVGRIDFGILPEKKTVWCRINYGWQTTIVVLALMEALIFAVKMATGHLLDRNQEKGTTGCIRIYAK